MRYYARTGIEMSFLCVDKTLPVTENHLTFPSRVDRKKSRKVLDILKVLNCFLECLFLSTKRIFQKKFGIANFLGLVKCFGCCIEITVNTLKSFRGKFITCIWNKEKHWRLPTHL